MDLETIHSVNDVKAVGYDQFIGMERIKRELKTIDDNLSIIQQRIAQLEYIEKARHKESDGDNI